MLIQTKELALEAYLRENQTQFYKLAFSVVKNSEDAMDVVQDAIVKAFEKQGSLRDISVLKTWFYRILVNTGIDYLRRKKKLFYTDELPEMEDTVSQESQVVSKVDLYDAIQKLPQELKIVIILRFFEDMKIQDIATVTGENLSTTKNRLYRALDILRIDMKEGV